MSKTARALLTTTGAFTTAAPAPTTRPPSTGPRAGKKAAPFWMPAAAKKQLDYLTIEQDTTQQALLTEALNDLFTKYGKPPIA
jgi:hypothetical protein